MVAVPGRLGIAPQGYDERLLLAAQILLSTQESLSAASSQPDTYSKPLPLVILSCYLFVM